MDQRKKSVLHGMVFLLTLVFATAGSAAEGDASGGHVWSVRDVTQQKLADQMRDQFIIESDASMQRIEKSCPQRTCQQQLKAARKARDLKLEEIERERLLAVVQ